MAETIGVHHVGLSVADVKLTALFFEQQLGWKRTRTIAEYPAIYVSDGCTMLSLWQVRHPQATAEFDRNRTIGLHHLAFEVKDNKQLENIYQRLLKADNCSIEFAPQKIRQGPARHMICCVDANIRIEFIYTG